MRKSRWDHLGAQAVRRSFGTQDGSNGARKKMCFKNMSQLDFCKTYEAYDWN